MALCERYAVADVDSHIIEPADLWTSRARSEVGRPDPARALPRAPPGGRLVHRRPQALRRRRLRPGPAGPSTRRRTRRCCRRRSRPRSTPTARLAYIDEVGVHYQVLYPNILGFHSHVFLESMPRELATECVRAYNDWLVEWCSADPRRLIPMMMLPFWDIDESVAEMKRAYDLGHKGVLFAARYDKVGLPRLVDDALGAGARPGPGDGAEHELPRRLPRRRPTTSRARSTSRRRWTSPGRARSCSSATPRTSPRSC